MPTPEPHDAPAPVGSSRGRRTSCRACVRGPSWSLTAVVGNRKEPTAKVCVAELTKSVQSFNKDPRRESISIRSCRCICASLKKSRLRGECGQSQHRSPTKKTTRIQMAMPMPTPTRTAGAIWTPSLDSWGSGCCVAFRRGVSTVHRVTAVAFHSGMGLVDGKHDADGVG